MHNVTGPRVDDWGGDSPWSRWLAGVLLISMLGGAVQFATEFPVVLSCLLAWIALALERLITETRRAKEVAEKP